MRLKVSFEIEVPACNATIEQAVEWIKYELASSGGISGANTLCVTDISDTENVVVDEI